MSFHVQSKWSRQRDVVRTKMQTGEFISVWCAQWETMKVSNLKGWNPFVLATDEDKEHYLMTSCCRHQSFCYFSHFAYAVNILPRILSPSSSSGQLQLTNSIFPRKPGFVRHLFFMLLYCPSHVLCVPINSLRVVTACFSPHCIPVQCLAHSGWTEFSYDMKLEMIVYWIITHRSKIS